MTKRTFNLLLIFVCFFAGIILFMRGQAIFAVICFVVSGIAAWVYYSNYSVLTALYLYSTNKNDKARKSVERIKNPDALSNNEKGNYYWLKGVFYAEDGKYDEAEEILLRAQKFLTRSSNAQFLICFSLAQIYAEKKEYEKAKQYIEESNKFPQAKRNAQVIDELLKKIEENEK